MCPLVCDLCVYFIAFLVSNWAAFTTFGGSIYFILNYYSSKIKYSTKPILNVSEPDGVSKMQGASKKSTTNQPTACFFFFFHFLFFSFSFSFYFVCEDLAARFQLANDGG